MTRLTPLQFDRSYLNATSSRTKAKRNMSDAVSALVAPIREVAALLYPLASYTILGVTLGTVGFIMALTTSTHARASANCDSCSGRPRIFSGK